MLSNTLPDNVMKNFLIYLSVPSKSTTKMKAHFILPVTIRKRFSLLQFIEDIHFGLFRMYVTPYRIFWILLT